MARFVYFHWTRCKLHNAALAVTVVAPSFFVQVCIVQWLQMAHADAQFMCDNIFSILEMDWKWQPLNVKWPSHFDYLFNQRQWEMQMMSSRQEFQGKSIFREETIAIEKVSKYQKVCPSSRTTHFRFQ